MSSFEENPPVNYWPDNWFGDDPFENDEDLVEFDESDFILNTLDA